MNTFTRIPFLRLILPFLLGIVFFVFVYQNSLFYYILFALSFFSLVLGFYIKNIHLKLRLQPIFGILLNTLLFSLAAIITYHNTLQFKTNHISKIDTKEYLVVTIDEGLIEKKNSYKSILNIESAGDSSHLESAIGKLLVYFQKDSVAGKLTIGDQLLIKPNLQEIDPPKNPGQFNYKKYLSFHQVHHQVYLSNQNWQLIHSIDRFSFIGLFDAFRNELLSDLKNKGFKNDEYAVAAALLLGKKDELDPELIQKYASAGAMHVLAVSGLHVGILFLVLNVLLKFLDFRKSGRLIKGLVLILSIWSYACITGLSPSVVRASTMFTAIIIGESMNNKPSIFNTIASSAFILLAINPYFLMEVGFQLSYLAVISIVYIQPKIYNKWVIHNWLGDKIWGITTVSVAAQIGTFPLGLLYFHQFPTLFMLSNLIVIPAAFLILFSGIIYFLIAGISLLVGGWLDFLSDLVSGILWWMIKILNEGVRFIEEIPYSLISGIDISVLESWMIYFIIFTCLVFIAYKRCTWLLISMSVTVVLLFMQIFEQNRENDAAYFTIYEIPKTTAINYIEPGKNLVFTDSITIQDDQKQLFYMKNNWNKKGAVSPKLIDFKHDHSLSLGGGFYQFKNLLVVHINDNNKPRNTENKIEVDLMIVSDNLWINWEEILDQYSPELVVLDSSNKYYVLNKWEEELQKLNQPFFNVSSQGAFELELEN